MAITAESNKAISPKRVWDSSVLKLFLFACLLGLGFWIYQTQGAAIDDILQGSRRIHPVYFLLAMSLLPVVGFPIALFYLYAGAAYGIGLGWALCLASLVVNMSLSYFVARNLLREPIQALVLKRGFEIPQLSETTQFRFTFLLRTVPGAPFPIQNYLLALASVEFKLYLALSLATQGVIALGMCALGNMASEPKHRLMVMIVLGLVAVLLGCKWVLKRRQANRGIK